MRLGIGNLGVSTVFFVPTSRCATNGFTSKRIPSELDWSHIGKIGRTKSASTTRCRRIQMLTAWPWQAERLPYNLPSLLGDRPF